MHEADVQRITRGVIADAALPFELLTVTATATGWRLTVRHASRAVMTCDIAADRPATFRAQVKANLDAHAAAADREQ